MSKEHKTIVLKGRCHHKEAECGTALKPGMGINLTAAGLAQPDSRTKAEALKGVCMIAKEDGLQGQSILGSGYGGVTTYNAEDQVFYYMPNAGDEINLLVKDGEAITVGDYLVPEGGGTGLWVKAAGTETKYAFRAMETLTPTGQNDFIAGEYVG